MSQCGVILMNCEQGINTCCKCQNTFFFCSHWCIKLHPLEEFCFQVWISAWLAVTSWNGWRTDRPRLYVGLSARFSSFPGFPANPFNYVNLLVISMKRMPCTARYWQAGLTEQHHLTVLYIYIWWTPDLATQWEAKPFPAPVHSHLLRG